MSTVKSVDASVVMAVAESAVATGVAEGKLGFGEPPEVEADWIAYKEHADQGARNRLLERYYPLVRYIGERLLATLPRSIELDDLTSSGFFGLMDAIDGFDMTRGIKFKTYCSTRVRGAILDELRSQDWVPRLVRLKANKISRAGRALEARLGRTPNEEEMAQELGISGNELQEMREDAAPVSVHSLSDRFDDSRGDGGLEKADVIADKSADSPLEAINRRDVIDVLTRSLSQKERRIIIMYYYEGLTMKEIGRILDLTESRVCQIHSNVITRLKERVVRQRGPEA